jgi:iron complex transport system substrate-binding protein
MRRPIERILAVVLLASIAAACGSAAATPEPADAPATTGASSDTPAAPASAVAAAPASEPLQVGTLQPDASRPDGSRPDGSRPDGSAPRVYVDERGVEVEITSTERIIPLDGDVAEVVFALGLGDRVVATDLSATFPPEADALPQIGYQRALNAEPILAFEPTLLIGTDLAGPPDVIGELERVGVPVAIVPAPDDPTGPGAKIREIAEVLGVPEKGERLAAEVEAGIAVVRPLDPAATPVGRLRVAMLYLRGESTQLVFGSGTSIGWVIEATGSVNVADDLGIVETEAISAEALIAAAPDVLLVTEDGLGSVGGLDALLAMPAIAGTPAAASRAVLAYDAQLMLGNGPRTADFLARLVADLTTIRDRLVLERAAEPQEAP